MDYKICRNCNTKNEYADSYCEKCGFDITKTNSYDIISENGSDTIYRIWPVSVSKLLSVILTIVCLGGIGFLTYTMYEDSIKESDVYKAIIRVTGYKEKSAVTSVDSQSVESVDDTVAEVSDNSRTTTKKRKIQKGFVLPNSNKKKYSDKKLKKLSNKKLAIARNEIYARRGYIFTDESWRAYFEKKEWYSGEYSSDYFNEHSGEIFNKYEKANLKKILRIERKRKG